MVLLQKAHDGVEVAHVFADHESEVTGMDLLVMDDVVADLIAGPLSVRGVRQDVLDTSKHSDRHSADVLERDQVGLSLSTDDVCVVVSEDLEAILFHILSVVQDSLDAGAVGLVAHIDGKSVIVIELWVLVDEKFGNELAERWDVGAEELSDSLSEPVRAEELMDAKQGASICKLGVEIRCKLEDTSLSVGDLRHGAEGDEQGHFVAEVSRGVLRQRTEHLSGTLGVADISNLLSTGLVLDSINHGR